MARNILETIMGAVVLLVAGAFFVFAYQQSAIKDVDGYGIYATFSDVSGISLGAEVRIGGMKIGVVEDMTLDPETYQAQLRLQLREDIELPKDSSAAIASTGLLGDKFVKLEPGGAEAMLEPGDTIRFTQSSISFEELLGKFVFSGGGVESPGKQNSGGAGNPDGSGNGSNGGNGGEAAPEENNNPFSLGL